MNVVYPIRIPADKSKALPEVQAKAEKLGWIPPNRFKGDPERFIDAEDYIKRGEEVLPIVKEHNKRLTGEVAELRTKSTALETALAAATKAIEEIEERHSVDTQKAVENARKQLKAQLAAASEAGDHEAIAELTDQMIDLNKAEKVAEKKPTASAAQPFVPPADLVEWNEENPWFGKDKRKTALALGIAQELRDAGEKATGRIFFDKVSAEMEITLGTTKPEPRGDKVEGARSGSEGDTRQSGKKSYNNLPADARAACDADAKRFVGKGKRYETAADWRARYAEIYFEER